MFLYKKQVGFRPQDVGLQGFPATAICSLRRESELIDGLEFLPMSARAVDPGARLRDPLPPLGVLGFATMTTSYLRLALPSVGPAKTSAMTLRKECILALR